MSLIDATYFGGEINIGQVETPPVSQNLTWFIQKYEKDYLTLLLGETLYTDFIAGLLVDPIDAKWLALRNAILFTNPKESPIANYIYYWYTRSITTATVGIGQVKPAAENGTIVSFVTKQVRAWNEMVKWNYSIIRFLRENNADYPDWNEVRYWSWYNQYCIYNRFDSIFHNINSFNI